MCARFAPSILLLALALGALRAEPAAAQEGLGLALRVAGQSEAEISAGSTVEVEAWFQHGDVDGIKVLGFSVEVPATPPDNAEILTAAAVFSLELQPFLPGPAEIIQPEQNGPGESGELQTFALSTFGPGVTSVDLLIARFDLRMPCLAGGSLEILPFFRVGLDGIFALADASRDLSPFTPVSPLSLRNPSGEACQAGIDLSADPPAIAEGSSSTIRWDATGFASCEASGDWQGPVELVGSVTLSLTQSATYELTCLREGGEAAFESVAVEVSPQPAVRLTLSSYAISQGDTTEVTWEATGAEFCVALGVGDWVGVIETEGTRTVSPAQTAELGMECTGSPGTYPMLASQTVRVGPVGPVAWLEIDRAAIVEGEPVFLSYNVVEADECTFKQGLGQVQLPLPDVEGTLVFTPSSTEYWVLSCFGFGEGVPTDTSFVGVAVRPLPFVSLTADREVLAPGEVTLLRWRSGDTASCMAAGGWTGQRLMSGAEIAAPSVTSDFELTCSTLWGAPEVSGRVSIEVLPSGVPIHDACERAEAVALDGAVVEADSADASPDVSDPIPPCTGVPDGATLWYAVASEQAGAIEIETVGSDYDTVVSVWSTEDDCSAMETGTPLACNDDSDGLTSRVRFDAEAGVSYRVQIGARNSGGGGALRARFVPEPLPGPLTVTALATLLYLRRRLRNRRN